MIWYTLDPHEKQDRKTNFPKSSDDINFSESIIKELNRKQFNTLEVASNLQKVRGYVNDGTRILNGITLNRYSEAGNELRVISFMDAPKGAIFYASRMPACYINCCSLMISLNWRPSFSAAFLQSTIRCMKISKYSITEPYLVSTVSLSFTIVLSSLIFSADFLTE